MAKAENKTQSTAGNVEAFLAGIEDDTQREDSRAIAATMAVVEQLVADSLAVMGRDYPR